MPAIDLRRNGKTVTSDLKWLVFIKDKTKHWYFLLTSWCWRDLVTTRVLIPEAFMNSQQEIITLFSIVTWIQLKNNSEKAWALYCIFYKWMFNVPCALFKKSQSLACSSTALHCFSDRYRAFLKALPCVLEHSSLRWWVCRRVEPHCLLALFLPASKKSYFGSCVCLKNSGDSSLA